MRVLFLAPQPFYQERGTPIAVKIALEALSKKLQLDGATGDVIDLLCYAEGQDITVPGVQIHRIWSPRCLRGIRPGISLKKLACDVIFFWTTLMLIIKNRARPYTILHAVEESVFIAWIVQRIWGIPYIYDMDSSLSLQITDKWRWIRPIAPILQWIEGMAIRSSIAVAPVCDALSVIASQHGSPHTVILRDVSLLHNSTEQNAERNSTLGLTLDPAQPVILYVGNLEFYQGIDLLLCAFACNHNHPSKPHLVIVGGAPEHIAEYRQRASALGCSHAVSFLGPKPVSDLRAYLSAADILVSPRIKGNNTPMKIYSYMHAGRALLATDLPTHRQVLDDEIALLAPCEINGFALGLRTLLDNPEHRCKIANRAQSRAESLYTLSAFEEQLAALYDQAHSTIMKVQTSNSIAAEEA